ncbi:3-oxoadipate CoA-transferase subunit A [Candidatus Terasakiella magnetica]|uniref:3-oxoadipate CoA-transferase subunit A n=1 Tax=Candidatus Terasakiella magnetica TaxID=1867952 RepID=A0A1C3RFH3_9PROT|nr:CoA-transferase [Candidatus Terasakiella magnetica]SCA56030.1 3-oxoadipate CoA-transferase subunit A [Candidatus Terasakiella magnetica]
MAEFLSLKEAVAKYVQDGDTLAMEGFTHLIPHAAGQEIIRQGKKDLTLIRMTPDLIYDQLIGMGVAKKLVFSWGGNPGVGSLHRLRDAYEKSWPRKLEIEEHSHAAMASAYEAGAANMPFAVINGYLGTDYPKVNKNIRSITCPFTGKEFSAVPSVRPDVAVIHAQRADRRGNVHISGIVGVQKEAVMAAKHSIVTVEEIVDELDTAKTNSFVLPRFVVGAICEVPSGSFPSYAHGYTTRNNAFYKVWDEIARDRESFTQWMKAYVLDVPDWNATYEKLKEDGYV